MTIAFWIYQIFIISWFTHLTSRLPALGLIRFDFILVLILIILTILSPNNEKTKRETKIDQTLKILIAYSIFAIPFGQWPGSVIHYGLINFIKAFVFYIFTVSFVKNEKQLKILLFIFISCQTFRILEPLYLHITEEYWGSGAGLTNWEYMSRLSGAPHDVVNPNGLAFIVVTTFPFLYYLSGVYKKIKLIFLIVLPLYIWTLILTSSRTGIIALTFLTGSIAIKSRHKIKLLATVIICILLAIPALSSYQKDRYLSIFSDNTLNANTAHGRITGLASNLQVALRKPFLGHGLGTSLEANANFGITAQPAHNLYIEVFQELGLVGLLIFLYYLYTIFSTIRDEKRQLKQLGMEDFSFINATWNALQVFFVVNLIFSFLSFGLSGYEWYLLPGLVCVIIRIRAQNYTIGNNP